MCGLLLVMFVILFDLFGVWFDLVLVVVCLFDVDA